MKEINKRYDYLVYDKHSLDNRIKLDKYDIGGKKDMSPEDEIFSDTEITDEF